MKKALLYSIFLFFFLLAIAFTSRLTTSLQATIAPFFLRASQQQGILNFPDDSDVTPKADDQAARNASFSDSERDQREQELLRLINEHRVANGRHELILSPEVTVSARSHAEYLGEINECKHDSGIIGEELPIIQVSETDFPGVELRENLACGSNDPQMAFDIWASEPGHNNTMLATDATHIGIALNPDKAIYVMKIARAHGVTPGQQISTAPTSVTPTAIKTITPSVTLTGSPVSPSAKPPDSSPRPLVSTNPVTRQVDWVYEGQGVCWSAWAGNQCSLQAHEGGSTTVSRDLNKDGQADISCSQGDGTNQTTTVTNNSDRSITLSCERYECNQCATGNGTHAQCDGAIDRSANRISDEILLEPGCSLTCTFAGAVGNCNDNSLTPVTPTPTETPTPELTFAPTSTPTGTATPTDTEPAPDPELQAQTSQVTAMLSSLSVENIRSIIQNLVDDDEVEGTDEQQTRYTGTDGNDTEAEYILAQLESYGFQTDLQTFSSVESILSSHTCPSGTEMTNISARIEGTDSSQTYMLVGHYDSISDDPDFDPAPGADDNASGTATALEIARVFAESHSQKPLKYSLEIVLFDAEELGLCGSTYYVSQLDRQKKDSIRGILNIDMIGFSPSSETCSYAAYNKNDPRTLDLVKRFATMNDHYDLETNGFAEASSQKNSDHASFWNVNLPAIMISECYPEQNENYHKTTDTIDALNFTQIQKVAQSVTATLAELTIGIPYRDTLITPTTVPQPTEPPATTNQPTTPPATGACSLTAPEQEMIRLVNEYRSSQGIAALTVDCKLADAARRHAQDQAAMNADQTATTSPHCTGGVGDGRNCPQGTVMTRVQATGYRYLTVQENIYAGTNPVQALEVWKSSTGHNNVLMSTNPQHIGVGVSDFGIVLVIATPDETITINLKNNNTSHETLYALLLSVFN